MLRVVDITGAGQLIGLLPVFAAALTVGLAGDGGVAAMGPADPPRSEHDVDGAEHILHAVTVVFDATGVQQKTGLRRAPPLGRLAGRLFGNTGHLGLLGGQARPAEQGESITAVLVLNALDLGGGAGNRLLIGEGAKTAGSGRITVISMQQPVRVPRATYVFRMSKVPVGEERRIPRRRATVTYIARRIAAVALTQKYIFPHSKKEKQVLAA